MANLVLCCIFDSKTGAFMAPFSCTTRGEAIRTFTDACRDSNLPLIKHVSDYSLHIVGEFDTNNGTVHGNGTPDRVIGGDEI